MIKNSQTLKGFTLVELLVVMTIVGILAAVVLFIIDPAEVQRKSYDSSRLADLSSLNTAISAAITESSDNVEAVLCKGGNYPCTGSSYPVGGDTRKNDGTGWIKVDLSHGSLKFPALFVDPVNDSVFHFTYCADNDAWELNTTLQSKKEKPRMADDAGDQNAMDVTGKYEVGSNLTLINNSGSPCAY